MGRPFGGLASLAPISLPPLDTVTPGVDAFARAHQGLPPPNQVLRWHDSDLEQKGTSLVLPAEHVDTEAEKQERRRRAREWVDRMVPMQTAEDDPDIVEISREIWDLTRKVSKRVYGRRTNQKQELVGLAV